MVIMIFQSMAVSFGAVGTPIRIGLDAGLGQGSIDSVNAVLASGQTWQQYLIELGGKVAILHGIVGVFIPLFIVVMLTGFFGKNRSFKEGFGAWKFALFGGLAISIPYTLTAVFLGPEFPSIFGGLIGVVITVIAASKGWFMPKDQVWDFPEKSKWDQAWFSTLRTTEEQERVFPYSMFRAWLPYIIMAVLLLITRLDFLPLADWLPRLEIGFTNLFGTELGETIAILHSPGTIFIAVSILTYLMHGMHKEAYQQSLKDAFKLI